MNKIFRNKKKYINLSTNDNLKEVTNSVIAILLALLVGALIITLIGESPIRAYSSLLRGSLGSYKDFSNTLSKTIPLIFTGLAVAVGFRGGMFNIGAEGQLVAGAMVSAIVALKFAYLPRPLMILLIFTLSIFAGMFIGVIPGLFKSKFKINEVIVGIMMNYLVLHFTSYLANGPLKAEGTVAQTEMIYENARLTKLIPKTQLTTALFIALITISLVYIFLWRTSLGYKIRSVGVNASAADASGINSSLIMIFTMALSAGISSLAGITEVLGKQYRFVEGFSPSYGFTGIAVAVLGKNHPFGIILSSLLFGILDTGSLRMSRETDVSSNIIVVIQAMVILFVAAPSIINNFRRRRNNKNG